MLCGANGDKLAVAPAPREKRLAVEEYRRLGSFQGEVMAVTEKSITIRGGEDGFINRPGAKPVIQTFPAGDILARGEQDLRESNRGNYPLTVVRVGDVVFIMVHERGEEDVCAVVRIRRRPGGLVPPAPWDDSPTNVPPYHAQMRLRQAVEEGIIPDPDKDPLKLAREEWQAEERRKFFEMLLKIDKGLIAPMPRLAKPK